jgi:hypothetical protein
MFKHGRVCIVRNANTAGIISKAEIANMMAKGLASSS